MAEAQRIQGVQMEEAQRVQGAEAQGKQFMFGAREGREQQKIDRVAGQLSGATAQEGQANANYTSALTGMIGGIASTAGSFMTARGNAAGGGGGDELGDVLGGGLGTLGV